MRVMVTSGTNVHAPDYHAEITAEKIISAAEHSVISIAETSTLAPIGRDRARRMRCHGRGRQRGRQHR